MLIALAIRRRALACAVLVGATSACGTCRGQPIDALAQGLADRGARYAEPSLAEPPPEARRGASASTTPALGSWPDETPYPVDARIHDEGYLRTAETSHDARAPRIAVPWQDSQLSAASLPADRDRRRLGPPNAESRPTDAGRKGPVDSPGVLPKFGLPLESMYTTGTALSIVVGLFLLCVWALRRGARKSTSPLPEDVVSVLGRVPLAARQFAQLVQVGNKLVLLSVTPAGAETLTEITDPAEIDRLLGLCMQRKKHSSTSEFDDVFRELAKESAPDELVGRGTTNFATRTASDAYAAYRGGADRG